MPNNFVRLLHTAATNSPDPSALHRTLLEAALIDPWDRYSEKALTHLINVADLDDQQRELLLACTNDGIRKTAWEVLGPKMSVEEWEAPRRFESYANVRRAQLGVAPLKGMSLNGIAALFGADPADMSVDAALRVLETFYWDGMQELWTLALRPLNPTDTLPPHADDVDRIDNALVPLLSGEVDVLDDPTMAPLFRFASALAVTAPEGSLHDLATEILDLPEQLGQWFRRSSSDWRETLFTAPVGRRADIDVFIDIERHFGTEKELTDLEKAFFNAHLAEQVKATLAIARATYGSDMDALPRIARATWDRIPDRERDDKVCANLLRETQAGHDLHLLVLEHLGERARTVIEDHDLLEADAPPVRYLMHWVGVAAVDVWLGLARQAKALTVADIPAAVVTAAAADLLAHPDEWLVQPAAAIAAKAGFGPAEWARLTTAQVLRISDSDPAAVQWVSDLLDGDADGLLDPVRLHAAGIIAETKTPLADVLTAVRGLD